MDLTKLSPDQINQYIQALREAEYTTGVGYRVTFEGRTIVLDAVALQTALNDATKIQKESRTSIGDIAGAVGRGIKEAVTTSPEEASAAAVKRGRAAESKRLSKEAGMFKGLVDAYEKASKKVASTAEDIKKGTKKPSDLVRWETELGNAEKALNQAGLFVSADGRIVQQMSGGQQKVVRELPGMGTSAMGSTGPVVSPTSDLGMGKITPTETVINEDTSSNVTPVVNKTSTVAQNNFVNREINNRGLSDTPANRKRLRDEFKKMSSSDAWLETFKKDYPGYADWTSQDVANYFGQDFINVLMEVSRPDVEYSDDEIKRMVRNTAYFQTTTTSQQDFDKMTPAMQQQSIEASVNSIRSTYGDLQFSENDLQTLGRKAARDKLTGIGLKAEVFRTAFRAQTTGVQTQALTGAEADTIQAIARSFGRAATNDEIQSILTGQATKDGRMLTTEMFRQQLQQEAIAAFPQLQKQIEAGLSLDTIGSRYKSYAAELLEMDPEQIDMFSGPYLDAFGTAQTGPLSLGEWTQKVKSDSRFGWQYTNQANQQATDIALTLARAFGKVQ